MVSIIMNNDHGKNQIYVKFVKNDFFLYVFISLLV